MNNFQLYRTNLYLGGQMKWDIIIDSANASLYVSDFHLSPISKNVSYTHRSDENLVNNKHQDNVKNFYNQIRSSFYSEALDSEFNHNWPIISKPGEVIDCYSNTYDMGCRRMKSYKLYNKQFEFLCPVWIEHITDDLKFEIIIKGVDSNTVLSKNALILKKNGLSYHDKFVNYFKNYISDAGLDSGCDDLLNIKFKDSTAAVSGLRVDNGILTTRNVNSLADNMVLRERPLMDVDKMLVNAFADNNMISKQLFNFNLCFNINDILTGSITQLLHGKEVSISINVYIGDEILTKKDFYTEYEFIPKHVIMSDGSSADDININVLDYLHDYEAIDLINKNKFSQNIIHWSLYDENDYIFNLYDGFSGIYVDKVGESIVYHENAHQYKDAANTSIKKADKSQNSTGWMNTVKISYWSEFFRYITSTNKMKTRGIHIFNETCINNIKYARIPVVGESGFYLIGMYTNSDIFTTIKDSRNNFGLNHYAEIGDDLIIIGKDDLVMVISYTEDKLSFSNFKDILYYALKPESEIEFDELSATYINAIYSLILSKIDPELIFFGGTIQWNPADGPNRNTKEVIYYNDNETQEYLMRYDGKIKPTFVDKNEKLYYKDYISDNGINSKLKNSIYTSYVNTGYEPLYPSIGYCAIKSFTDWKYEELPELFVSEHKDKVVPYGTPEYSWFNANKNLILVPEIHCACENKKIDGKYKSVMEIAEEYLHKFYDITDSDTIKYILSKYNVSNKWEYFSETNVDDYIYNLTFKLK